jgi:hypothetical protein
VAKKDEITWLSGVEAPIKMATALIAQRIAGILLRGAPMNKVHSEALPLAIFVWSLNSSSCNSRAHQPRLLAGLPPQLAREVRQREANPPLALGDVCCLVHAVEDQPRASVFVVKSSTVVLPRF